MDNTAVVFILKNMGTSLNYLLNEKCNLIWEWWRLTSLREYKS